MNLMERWDALKEEWTGIYVTANPGVPQLARFNSLTGKVVAVNGNLKCLVDFQDGAWYDIAPEHLVKCPDQAQTTQHFKTKNSAKPQPVRQG